MKKICFYILIFSFLNYTGCYSSKSVSKEVLFTKAQAGSIDEIAIITNENSRVMIDEVTYQVIDDTLYATGINKTNISHYGQPRDIKIALADIQYVEVEEPDNLATAGLVIGSAGIILLILMVIAVANYDSSTNSCAPEGFGFEGGKD